MNSYILYSLASSDVSMIPANASFAIHHTTAMGRVEFNCYYQGAFKVNTGQFYIFN